MFEPSPNGAVIERNHSREDHHRLIHRNNDGARDALVDDFRNGTLAEGKDGCAARHRLDHHQAERLRPTLETRMATGTVKWFNPTKGYGFIEPTGAGKDMFVHISAVEQAGLSTLNEGQSIEYEIESNRGKESAVKLKVK